MPLPLPYPIFWELPVHTSWKRKELREVWLRGKWKSWLMQSITCTSLFCFEKLSDIHLNEKSSLRANLLPFPDVDQPETNQNTADGLSNWCGSSWGCRISCFITYIPQMGQLEWKNNPQHQLWVQLLVCIFWSCLVGFVIIALYASVLSETRMVGLLATNQTEFTMEAVLTCCSGWPGRTRDMVNIYACICGSVVANDARVTGLNTALCCGFNSCKTLWVCCYILQILSEAYLFWFPTTVSLGMPQFWACTKGLALWEPCTHMKTCTYGLGTVLIQK